MMKQKISTKSRSTLSLNLNTDIGGENHWEIYLHCIVANIQKFEWHKIHQVLAANEWGARHG